MKNFLPQHNLKLPFQNLPKLKDIAKDLTIIIFNKIMKKKSKIAIK